MPVVAAIGGIASAAAGASAIAGTVGGFAAMSLGSAIVAGVQIVSGVAATLGAITGNKTLQKIGLVGAVASTAISGLNSLSDGALFGGGEAADMMGSVTDASASNGLTGVGSLEQTSAAIDAAEGGVGLLGSAADTSAAIDAANAAAGYGAADTAAKVAQSGADVAQQAAVAGVPAPTGASAEMAAQTNYALNTGSDALRMPGVGLQAGGVQLPPAPTPSSGLLGSVLDFTKDNPGAMKTIAGLGGGLAQGYMQQRAEAAKLEAQEAARRRYNESILNQRRI